MLQEPPAALHCSTVPEVLPLELDKRGVGRFLNTGLITRLRRELGAAAPEEQKAREASAHQHDRTRLRSPRARPGGHIEIGRSTADWVIVGVKGRRVGKRRSLEGEGDISRGKVIAAEYDSRDTRRRALRDGGVRV